MSEITVRQEVEVILNVARRQVLDRSDEILDALGGAEVGIAVATFHGDVLAELDGIIEDYANGGQPVQVAPAGKQKRLSFKVGDKVRLTGEHWARNAHGYSIGDVVTITGANEVNPYQGKFGDGWFVWTTDVEGNEGAYGDWGGDILSEDDLEIRVGDTVRITDKYAEALDGEAEVGQEFVVTERVETHFDFDGNESSFFVRGDRLGRGAWECFIEKVFK